MPNHLENKKEPSPTAGTHRGKQKGKYNKAERYARVGGVGKDEGIGDVVGGKQHLTPFEEL